MKLLSVAVPCYNSQDYMEHCVETLVTGGDLMEVIIVNDGSKDNTEAIGKQLVEKYPNIVKLISQENGGHGEAVNTGIANATGVFFKVVDSDDWVDEAALQKVLKTLEYMEKENKKLDMLLSNFVYDKVGVKKKKSMAYRSAIEPKHITSWDGAINFKVSQYILMHSVIYRTQLLKDCGLKLPSHTFYVDNIYVFKPLPYVKRLCYIDVDFYHYFIGREDQSVNEKVMISRIDQHIKVVKQMMDEFEEVLPTIESPKLKKYMFQYLDMMMCVASVLLIIDGKPESLEKKAEFWAWVKENHPTIHKKVRYTIMGIGMNIPTPIGKFIAITGYKIAHKIFGFN